MAKANLNKHAKRTREQAKQGKRADKDEKRAQKKTEARVARGDEVKAAPAPLSAAAKLKKLLSTPPPPAKTTSPAAAAFIRNMKLGGGR